MSEAELIRWANEKVVELSRHAEYRGRQVEESKRRGSYNFILARDALYATCTVERLRFGLHKAEQHGEYSYLQAERDRMGGCGCDWEEARGTACG